MITLWFVWWAQWPVLWWVELQLSNINICLLTLHTGLDWTLLTSSPHLIHLTVQGIFRVGRKPISHDGHDGWYKQGVSPHSVGQSAVSISIFCYISMWSISHHTSQTPPPRLGERYIGISWHRHNQLNWQKLTQGEKINFHLFPPPVGLPVSATGRAEIFRNSQNWSWESFAKHDNNYCLAPP